jgi:hypothetical protein
MRRLFVYLEGHEMPHIMNLAPSSLKMWGKYVVGLGSKKLRPRVVMTKFTATPDKNRDKIAITRVVPTFERVVTKDELVKVMGMAEGCEAYSRPPVTTDYQPDEPGSDG